MKLSPPASSSDLEAAREVARRLNRIALPPEAPRPLPPYTPLHHGRPLASGAIPPLPVPTAPTPPPPPTPPYVAVPPPVVSAPPPATPAFTRPALEPEWAPVSRPETPATRPDEEEPVEESVEESVEEEAGPAAAPEHVSAAPPVSEAAEPPPPSAPPAPFRPPAASLDTDTGPIPEEPGIEEDLGEDQVDETEVETPLTWSDVVNSCLSLAEGKGALLINPDGHVIAVAGEWPAPGAEAIAARLVPAMDKALKDAPTRSVSVPLGGLHLTAWRAPMVGGLMTIGFVAEAPLRPELRPSIDATLKQGPQ